MTNCASAHAIANQRHLFDIPDEVAYLNCAYMGPLMRSVVEAGDRGIREKARPWGISPDDFFVPGERAREQFARIIGADAEGVALVPSASYGLSCAARNIDVAPGARLVVLAEQFPSIFYTWREVAATRGASLVTVARPEDDDWTRATLDAIDERTASVALPHCHWTDGGYLDLVRIGTRCREVGAVLVLDLTQSAGALRFDAGAVRPDYVVCAGYKWLLGPYSLGFLWVAPEHRDGRPIEFNWIARAGSEDFARLIDYRDDYQPGARRFDVGERSNFILVPMLNAALEQILAWGVGGHRGDPRPSDRGHRGPCHASRPQLGARCPSRRAFPRSAFPERRVAGRAPLRARRRAGPHQRQGGVDAGDAPSLQHRRGRRPSLCRPRTGSRLTDWKGLEGSAIRALIRRAGWAQRAQDLRLAGCLTRLAGSTVILPSDHGAGW